jgi:hypothetical protein
MAKVDWGHLAHTRVNLLLENLNQLKILAKITLQDTIEDILLHAGKLSFGQLYAVAKECVVLMHLIRLRLAWTMYRLEKSGHNYDAAYEKFRMSLQNLYECLNDTLRSASDLPKIEPEDHQEIKELLNLTQKALTELSNFIDKSLA